MYRHKPLIMEMAGIRSSEESVEEKLDELENYGMIDLMVHQFNRYKRVTHFTLPKAVWTSWIRR